MQSILPILYILYLLINAFTSFFTHDFFFADLSEADLIYTETLMQRGKECYTGKEIVILGGGDGGLLWELLKEKPKYVMMLEVRENPFVFF